MLDAPVSPPASTPPPVESGETNVAGYFEIKAVPDRATLLVKSSLQMTSIVLTPELVKEHLARAKVVAGFNEELLGQIIENKLYDRTHIVAVVKPAQDGKDARLEELVKVESDITPKLLENGSTDYKNVDNINAIKAGTVLARKHPATPGEPGLDVFGKPTLPKPGKDAVFKVGLNVSLSPDGLELIAGISGFLYRQAGAICVGEGYTVKGNVGFKTGNIHYHGMVQVQGDVGDGFAVETDGDILIEGVVDGSNLTSHEGNILVKQSVFGHGNARIYARGDLRLHAAQDAELGCGGVLEAQKLLRNCKITARTVKSDAPGCLLQGGKLCASGDVVLANVGGEGLSTEITLIDPELEKRRQELNEMKVQIEKVEALVRAMEQKLKGMKALAAKMNGHLTDRMITELRAAVQRYGELQKEQMEINARKDSLTAAIRVGLNHPGSVSIKEKVLGAVKINLYGHTRELSLEDGGKRWVWSEDGLIDVALT